MPPEHAVALAGLGFLVLGGVCMVRSVRRGREACHLLSERHPDLYAALGSPRPSYFDSARRNVYFRFLKERGYTELGDPHLVDVFTALRRSELRFFALLLAGFAALGLAFAWIEWG